MLARSYTSVPVTIGMVTAPPSVPIDAMNAAVYHAKHLVSIGVHKQWANRLLEPFAWHTVIVTATEWANYWALRVSEMAQPEIFTVSEKMKELYEASEPVLITLDYPLPYHVPLVGNAYGDLMVGLALNPGLAVRLSVARCARVSYLTHDGVRDPKADEELYERLTTNGHMSPTEHAARPMSSAELNRYGRDGEGATQPPFCGNFRGWVQHRKEIPGEAVFGGDNAS